MRRLLLIMLLAPLDAHAGGPVVLKPTENIGGQPQAAFVSQWWQWVMRLPDGVRAYQDPSGAQCGLNQSGPVWFLAGTEGTDEVARECTIPGGRYLLLPVIAAIGHSKPGHPLSCTQAKAAAQNDHGPLQQAQVILDGKAITGIEHYRQQSSACFDAFANAKYLDHPESYMPSATDGYWLMLRPLPAGIHHLSVRARYGSTKAMPDGLEQVFEYELHIQDSDTTQALRPSAGTDADTSIIRM